jgi:predicted type IV restriction endonuclease
LGILRNGKKSVDARSEFKKAQKQMMTLIRGTSHEYAIVACSCVTNLAVHPFVEMGQQLVFIK